MNQLLINVGVKINMSPVLLSGKHGSCGWKITFSLQTLKKMICFRQYKHS